MILRRFKTHVSDQNWFVVGLDILVVVFGVYIGIYLGELQSERATRQEVIKAVEVLEQQLEADLANLDDIIAYRTQKLTEPEMGIQELVKSDPDLAVVNTAVFLNYRQNFTYFPNSSGYSVIKDRGFLPNINDVELLASLTDLYDRIYERHLIIAQFLDRTAFDYDMHFARVYWDADRQAFIGDPSIAASRLRNALRSSQSEGESYVEFLSEIIRPGLVRVLEAIDAYQDIQAPGESL